MFMPIVHYQPMLWTLIQPARTNQRSDERILVLPIVQSQSDVFIAQLANVAPWRFPCREMPQEFQ
jgi:hypothetical protein